MGKTKIEWATHSWNPVTGCTKVSPGCAHCFAERMARRLAGRHGYPPAPHHFDVTLRPERLEQPLRWKKPRRVFVCSMSDLFHEEVPTPFIADLWDVMAEARQHTFQILTKRVDRLPEVFHYLAKWKNYKTPLSNIWLGVTVESQATADERREHLRQCPAAVKFVSYEPALGPVDWTGWEFVDQIISGGESGPGARPSHPDWHRATKDFCQANGIAYFFKQWGGWIPNEDGCGGNYHFNSKHVCLNLAGELFDIWLESHGECIAIMAKASKKAAGRLLDGQTWDEYPREAQ